MLCSYQTRRIRRSEHVAGKERGEMHGRFFLGGGEPETKSPLERTKHKWDDNVRMYLTVTGMKGVQWISIVQDGENRLCVVKTITNLRGP